MTRLRDAAQELDTRYQIQAAKGYASVDSHFVREAGRLHRQMQRYAREWIFNPPKRAELEEFHKNTEEDIAEIVTKVAETLKFKRDQSDHKPGAVTEVQIDLPVEYNPTFRWDSEEVRLYIEEDDRVKGISFDEKFDVNRYCTNAQQLAESYAAGEHLSEWQLRWLIAEGLLDQDAKEETNGHPDNELPPVLPPVPSELPHSVSPLVLFGRMLSPELAVKLNGKSAESALYMTSSMPSGPLHVNARLHDYGSYQFIVSVETEHLSSEEVNELIQTYVDVLKAYPRVLKADKIR